MRPQQYKDTIMHQPTDANLSATLHGMTAEVATLHGELYRWMESPDFQPIYQTVEVGMDHLRAAALRLSIHVAYHLNTLIDWENSEHGVFTYDYCERSLPAMLRETLSRAEWYQLAANYTPPADLHSLLRDWVAAQPGLVLRTPGRDAAVKKLAGFGLSAEAAAQIHRHGLLNATFYDQ